VRRTPAQRIVEFLSFSSDSSASNARLKDFCQRDWKQALNWMDDAGLAFYVLRKIKDANATDTVSTWVISSLEQRFASNRQRVDDMAHRFDFLNSKFNDAGVRYVVLKGHSLIPEFCPDAALRHQSDFDYLVDEESLPVAEQVVIEAGYSPKPCFSSQGAIFLAPGKEKASRGREQYSAQAPHTVELHLDVWDSDANRLPSMPSFFSVNRTRTHQWNALSFPALNDEDAFLLQVMHACQHLFSYWIRMSCLFEIGFFLNQRASDALLWSGIDRRVGDSLMLREFVVLITELAAKLFAAPIPLLVRDWGQAVRPATRVWIDNYAEHCAFCSMPAYDLLLFPRAKLVLFLQQQYESVSVQRNVARLVKFSRPSRMISSIKDKPSLVLNVDWWKSQLFLRRSLFHVLAGLRYLCEIPRWRWLNRATMRSASPIV
jgi:hypothetical protein